MMRLARTELVILRAGILELDGMPHIPARAYCLNMLALLMHSMLMYVL